MQQDVPAEILLELSQFQGADGSRQESHQMKGKICNCDGCTLKGVKTFQTEYVKYLESDGWLWVGPYHFCKDDLAIQPYMQSRLEQLQEVLSEKWIWNPQPDPKKPGELFYSERFGVCGYSPVSQRIKKDISLHHELQSDEIDVLKKKVFYRDHRDLHSELKEFEEIYGRRPPCFRERMRIA